MAGNVVDNESSNHDSSAIQKNSQAILSENDLYELMLNTAPVDGKLLIVAFSPRFKSHDDELQVILLNAARQASIHDGANVSYIKMIDEDVSRTLQAQKIEIDYDKNRSYSILDKLEITDEFTGNDYFAAIVTYPRNDIPAYPVENTWTGQEPSWLRKPPQSPDFYWGVGIAQRRGSELESWLQADKQAVAEIADSIETTMISRTGTISKATANSSETVTKTQSISRTDVYIKGLYIISRWKEPDSSYYYSLAVVRKQE